MKLKVVCTKNHLDEGISDQPIVLSAEDVIEEWYRILVGLEPERADKNAHQMADHLLGQQRWERYCSDKVQIQSKKCQWN